MRNTVNTVNYQPLSYNNNEQFKLYQAGMQLFLLFSSLVCTVFIVLLYQEIKEVSGDAHGVIRFAQQLNGTMLRTIMDDLFTIEECVIHKLQLC